METDPADKLTDCNPDMPSLLEMIRMNWYVFG